MTLALTLALSLTPNQVLIPVGAEAHSNGGQAPTTGVERARFNVAMGLPESDVCHAGLEP